MSSTSIGGSILSGSQTTSASGGLGSGINISALVQASMANQLAELDQMQGQQTTVTNQQTALTSFSNDAATLQNAVFALTDPVGQFTSVSATSSNTSVLTANALSGTPTGSHSVSVTNLASTSSAYSNAVATSSTPLATGTLSIQVGTKTAQPITVNSSDNTLDGLASAINDANVGVTASVINDANGSRLALVSNTSGAAGNLTITPSSGVVGFNTGVKGLNASLTVDGIPISSATNTVSSAIPGVTLSLTGATGDTPISVTTGANVTQQASAINSFVSAYNTVIGDLNTQFAVNASTGSAGVLSSDSTLALAQGQILSAVSFSTTGNGTVNSLAAIGVTLNNDGTLSVDSATLSSALASNSSAIQNFFGSTTTGTFGNNLSNIVDSIANPLTGSLSQDATGYQQTQTSLAQQISDFQAQLNTTQQALTQQYVKVDTTLQQLPELLDQIDQQLSSLG